MPDLPVLAVMNFELLRVAAGHPMTVRTMDGVDMTLRLLTPDELLAVNAAAVAKLHAQGTHDGTTMTREQAVALTTPIGGDR